MTNQIPVTRSFLPSIQEYMHEIEPLWETRWLTNMGQKHQLLAQKLCEMMDVEYTALFTNGHLALEFALEALDLSGEVITTPFTFASTTQAIVRCGLTPVFCDISPDDFTMDTSKIESLITPRTSAILPVHVYGNICNVEEIERIAKKHGLKVIYDAAHAFGEEYRGRNVGSFGDLSMFSFHATKVFHTIEGGALTCHSKQLFDRISALKNFGQYTPEDIGEIGGNAKMSEFQAAMGLCNLRYLDDIIAARKKVADIYRARLKSVAGITVCPEYPQVKSNYSYFPITVDPEIFGISRDLLHERLLEKGILTRKYFYPATNEFYCYQGKFKIQETPVAKKLSEQVLVLPLYPDLSIEDAEKISSLILEEKK